MATYRDRDGHLRPLYDPRPIDPPGTWEDEPSEPCPSDREDRLESTVEDLVIALRTAGDLLIQLGSEDAGRIAITLADHAERKL